MRCLRLQSNSSARLKSELFTVWIFLVTTVACATTLTSQDRLEQAEFHYKLARNYYNDRNIAMTQRELHTALTLNPEHVEAHHLKGFLLLGLQKYDAAVAEFRETLRLKPDHHEARNNLGAALMAQERFEEAVQVLEPLADEPLYPTPSIAHYNLGYCYYRLGDLAKARQHLETSLFLTPGMCKASNALGLVLQQMGDIRGAREAFENATKQCPSFAEPYYNLGVMLQRLGDAQTADAMFARCAELARGSDMGKRCEARR